MTPYKMISSSLPLPQHIKKHRDTRGTAPPASRGGAQAQVHPRVHRRTGHCHPRGNGGSWRCRLWLGVAAAAWLQRWRQQWRRQLGCGRGGSAVAVTALREHKKASAATAAIWRRWRQRGSVKKIFGSSSGNMAAMAAVRQRISGGGNNMVAVAAARRW